MVSHCKAFNGDVREWYPPLQGWFGLSWLISTANTTDGPIAERGVSGLLKWFETYRSAAV